MTVVPLEEQAHAVRDVAQADPAPALQAAAATLLLFSRHAAGLRALIKFLRAADLGPGEQPTEEERAYLMQQPGVADILKTFPDAALVGIRPVAPISAPEIAEQGDLL